MPRLRDVASRGALLVQVRMRSVLTLLLLLVLANTLLACNAERWRFNCIVVHHSATRTGDYAAIKALHAKRGWNDAAYQLIMSNGSMGLPAGALEASGRYRNLAPGPATRNQPVNLGGLHLCIIGNYQTDPFPEAMKPALGRALRELCRRFHVPQDAEHVLFHRDVSPSVCPGKNIRKEEMLRWMHELADQCPPEIAAEQDKVLDEAGFGLRGYPTFVLLGHAVLSAVLILLWWIIRRIRRARARSNRYSIRPARRTARTPGRSKTARSGGTVRYPRRR